MRGRHANQISRRRFLGGLTVEGTAGLLSLYSKPIAAEPPPKLTVIRLVKIAFLASMLAYVGLDPRQDVTWVPHPHAEDARLLAAGRVDVLMAIPPEAQALRPKQIGHVVVNTMMDRPWSHDFCCMVTGNRAFVQKYPVASKRALRSIFKSVDRLHPRAEPVRPVPCGQGVQTRL